MWPGKFRSAALTLNVAGVWSFMDDIIFNTKKKKKTGTKSTVAQMNWSDSSYFHHKKKRHYWHTESKIYHSVETFVKRFSIYNNSKVYYSVGLALVCFYRLRHRLLRYIRVNGFCKTLNCTSVVSISRNKYEKRARESETQTQRSRVKLGSERKAEIVVLQTVH